MKYSRPKTAIWSFLVICLFLVHYGLQAQTTGKIAGMVFDESTNEPALGANVFLEGTYLGAAVDAEGSFFILNVTPGTYTLVVQMIGYETVKVENLRVSVNRTATVEVSLKPTIMETETVVVVAEKIAIKKDQTSSIQNVSSEEILALPVENMEQIVEMQAGVVDGHFRGGRLTEVAYLIDGMQVTESFNKGIDADGYSTNSRIVNVEPEAVQDLEVITGTFNAEYGRAMSGIVNMVTKEGGNDFHGSFTGYVSNYYTANSDVWIGLDDTEITRNQDYKIQLDGPIWKNKITFFANYRYQNSLGHINGIRRFNVDDFTDFTNPNTFTEQTPWDTEINGIRYYSEHTGDGAYVPINTKKIQSFMGKLTFKLATDLKISLMSTWNYDERPETGHKYKYKPDGRQIYYDETFMYNFQINHLISQSIFHDLKVSYTQNEYKHYLYEDPLDSRYVHRNGYNKGAGGFDSGGQDYEHYKRTLDDLNIKYDFSWQINNKHFLKTGLLFTSHRIHNEPTHVQNALKGTPLEYVYDYVPELEKVVFYPYRAELAPDSAISMDIYTKKPYEFSGYIQDKMEFEDMVINLGLRLDYFNPNTTYPSQRRNPANQLLFYQTDENGNNIVDADSNLILDPERMSTYPKADPQIQISPRFGLSYSLGEVAVLHFSYGHFFQMPPLYALYSNHRVIVPTGDFQTIHGNPQIKAEKTVQYEMGIWMELMPRMGLELSVYYKDIYDLQSAVVYTTYNQIKYGLYSNKDYGNAKGFELKYDYAFGPLSFFLNYTLQYTRGSADNSKSTYDRQGESLDPIPYLVPLNWDQRHTANASIFYSGDNYGITLTGYFNSGRPYDFTPVNISPLSKQTLYPNNSTRPSTYTVDLKGHYDFDLGESGLIRLSLSIYNLLDRKNELLVYSSTGRAYTDIVYPINLQSFRSNFNDYYDHKQSPYQYSAPRQVKLGLGYMF